jgi:tetratricopeptide (TPR) repeat protein
VNDSRGNPVATSSREALAAHERSLWHLVAFYGDPNLTLDAAIAADPGWPLAKIAKGVFLLTVTEPAWVPDARRLIAEAAAKFHGAPLRERAHLAAAQRCAAGRFTDACELWDRILAVHPTDMLALIAAHLFDFYRGDARNLRQRIARVLPAWDRDDPLYPFVLGMYAFGLEECNLYPQAEEAGRRALEMDPRGPWAVHAVAHVMEMEGRPAEGRDWLGRRAADWSVDNGLAVHLWWHDALFALESLDTAAALAHYDARIGGSASMVNLQWLDAAALLWRLNLLGVETRERWKALAQAWADPIGHAGWYAFNDVHALLAFLGSGDMTRADALIARTRERALQQRGDNHAMTTDVALPLMQGLRAYAQGDGATAMERLLPLRATAHRFGGSHAQRDLIDQTIYASATRGGDKVIARALLNERRVMKPRTGLTGFWGERLASS